MPVGVVAAGGAAAGAMVGGVGIMVGVAGGAVAVADVVNERGWKTGESPVLPPFLFLFVPY